MWSMTMMQVNEWYCPCNAACCHLRGSSNYTRTNTGTLLQMFYQTNYTQAVEITPRQQWNGPVCCWMMVFAVSVFHSVAAREWWEYKRAFLSLVTLTFDLDWGTTHVLPVNLVQIHSSGSRDIWFTNKKKQSHKHCQQAGWFLHPDCAPSSECPRASIAACHWFNQNIARSVVLLQQCHVSTIWWTLAH